MRNATGRQHACAVAANQPPGALAAFDALYQKQFAYVWKTLGRLGVRSADLPDAVHDVFLVVHRRWAELDVARPVRPWLFGIARRIAAGRRRKQRDVLAEPPERGSSGDEERIAERELLWRLLAELPDERREVIILHDLEGRTGADIAQQHGLSVNTVHSRLRLARADLAAALARLARGERSKIGIRIMNMDSMTRMKPSQQYSP
jgi:RNA polymerase sigma-70 factor (ECF subfamily)